MKNRQSFLTIYIYIYTISGKLKSPKKRGEVFLMKTIKLTWKTKKVKNSARVNQMYCFKSCGKNQN